MTLLCLFTKGENVLWIYIVWTINDVLGNIYSLSFWKTYLTVHTVCSSLGQYLTNFSLLTIKLEIPKPNCYVEPVLKIVENWVLTGWIDRFSCFLVAAHRHPVNIIEFVIRHVWSRNFPALSYINFRFHWWYIIITTIGIGVVWFLGKPNHC